MQLRNPKVIIAVATTALLCACTRTSTDRIALKDTEGRAFNSNPAASLPHIADHRGLPTPQSARPHRDATPCFVVHRFGQIFAACDAWTVDNTPAAPDPADCRPLICSTDAECPNSVGLNRGTCVGGFCVEPTAALVVDDAIVLCMASTGPPAGSPRQLERRALALTCGSPCTVPRVCPSPFPAGRSQP